jgi:hypothetical protein
MRKCRRAISATGNGRHPMPVTILCALVFVVKASFLHPVFRNIFRPENLLGCHVLGADIVDWCAKIL